MDDSHPFGSVPLATIIPKSMARITWQKALGSPGKQSFRYGHLGWNTHLHPSNHKQKDCSQLQAAVHQVFLQAVQDPILQDLVNSLTPDQIMTRPTWCIWQWATNCHNHMQAHRKALKLQAQLWTNDIWHYFKPKHHPSSSTYTDKNLLCPL